MAGKIPEIFIQQLLDKVEIVDVVHARVPLKQKGTEFTACCPFHDEKTPSFTVSQDKQFYHCFGCGAHGSAISFLMNYDGLNFPDAIEELADLVGVEVPREASEQRDNSPLLSLMQRVAAWYQQQLKHNKLAQSYLEQRGLNHDAIQQFVIGYAPEQWDALLNVAGKTPDQQKLLSQAGMLSESDSGKRYDKFRHRIMFPIHDRRGRVIAFGGRALTDQGPKYLNSPETPLFHKGRELYGLYFARKSSDTKDKILVVEGYMDVIALVQSGINNVVATLGTATTGQHVETLFRASSHVLYCFDGDRAGREAAWKALNSTLPWMQDGRQASFLFLQEGEDPDSLVRKLGEQAFRQQLEQALPLSEFLFDRLADQLDLKRVDSRAKFAKDVEGLLEKLPDGTFKQLMYAELERRVGLRSAQAKVRKSVQHGPQSNQSTPLRVAIKLLMLKPNLALRASVESFPIQDLEAGSKLLNELLELIRINPHLKPASLFEHWRGRPEEVILSKLFATISQDDGFQTEQVFDDALRRVRLEQLTLMIERTQQLIMNQPERGDLRTKMRDLLSEKNKISQ